MIIGEIYSLKFNIIDAKPITCCLTVVIPPPSPNPACSNFLLKVNTWVSTDLGPPLNGGRHP